MAEIKDKVSIEDITSFLQTEASDGRIIIGEDAGTGHITRDRVGNIRDEKSYFLEIALSPVYVRPLALTDAATVNYLKAIVVRKASFQIAQEVFRGQIDLPEYVERWDNEAAGLIERITTGGVVLPGEELIGTDEPTTGDYLDRDYRRPIVRGDERVFDRGAREIYGKHR